YFVDKKTVSDADRAERTRHVFPSFHAGDVRSIETTGRSGSFVLERDPSSGTFALSASGTSQPTDPAAVDGFLRELELAQRVRDVSREAAAGLDSPRVRGTLAVGPLEYRYALGDDAPSPSGSAYLSVEGDGAFVVN